MLSLLDYSKRIFLAVVIIIATLLIPYLLYKVLPHFVPFILAFLTAVFLEPISLFFAKKLKIKKTLAHTVTYLLFLGTILLLSYLIINKIYVQLVGLLSFIQDNGPLIQAWVMNVTQSVQDTISMLPYNAGDQINQIIIEYIDGISHINVASKLLAYTYSLSTAIPNFFLLTLIYLISVILFSFQLDNLRRGFYSFFKEKTKQKIILVLRDLRQAAMGFIKALIILSTITFILSFIGLMILQVKYSAIIALVIVLFDILPIIGPGSILVPWAVISLFRGDIFTGIGLLILFLIITVVRRSIEPKILGERIGLTGLATLISLWIGFKVMGVLGIFLFPLALIFYKALVKAKIININYKF